VNRDRKIEDILKAMLQAGRHTAEMAKFLQVADDALVDAIHAHWCEAFHVA